MIKHAFPLPPLHRPGLLSVLQHSAGLIEIDYYFFNIWNYLIVLETGLINWTDIHIYKCVFWLLLRCGDCGGIHHILHPGCGDPPSVQAVGPEELQQY